MDSLKQYIDLYLDHEAALRTGGEAIDRLRRPALVSLEEVSGGIAARMPYPECSYGSLFAPDYGVNLQRMNFSPNLGATFHCGVPNISTLLGVVVNDVFRPTDNLLRQLPQGVTVTSLAEAARRMPQLVEPYLGKLAGNTNPAAALNSLLLQDGVLVHVADGVSLDKPVQIVNIFNAPASLLASRRLLVVLGKGAACRLLLCDHTQRHDTDYLSNEVAEIFVGEDSHLEIYSIQENTQRTNRVCCFFARQEARSHMEAFAGDLMGGVGRTDYNIDLAGEHAECTMNGLVIADGGQLEATNVHLRHLVPNCRSRQLFKFALFGDARGAFGGKIVVEEGAAGTDAAQTNRNLLASEDSRMASAPQLEIYCDDVKCSHGATTGQLDSSALFYMQTRGIPRQEAQMMLTQAFMSDIVDGIAYDIIRDRMRQLVEKRLGGQAASCAGCTASKTCADE